jgi:hypothetical protein
MQRGSIKVGAVAMGELTIVICSRIWKYAENRGYRTRSIRERLRRRDPYRPTWFSWLALFMRREMLQPLVDGLIEFLFVLLWIVA